MQAAVTSSISFSIGGLVPLLTLLAVGERLLITTVATVSLLFLALLGALAARAGGASMLTGASRVMAWGAVAMAVTALVGSAFGAIL
jgi:VIT1/CCC1 family predicted Fe2+/Mn2+ transporter